MAVNQIEKRISNQKQNYKTSLPTQKRAQEGSLKFGKDYKNCSPDRSENTFRLKSK